VTAREDPPMLPACPRSGVATDPYVIGNPDDPDSLPVDNFDGQTPGGWIAAKAAREALKGGGSVGTTQPDGERVASSSALTAEAVG